MRADTSPARRARAMKSFEQRDWKTNIGRCANETCHLEKGCINVLLHLKIVFFQNESQICAHVQMLGICDEVDTIPANGGSVTIGRGGWLARVDHSHPVAQPSIRLANNRRRSWS